MLAAQDFAAPVCPLPKPWRFTHQSTELIDALALDAHPKKVLVVGPLQVDLLDHLRMRFPEAHLVALDPDARAEALPSDLRTQVTCYAASFLGHPYWRGWPDCIVFSYGLSNQGVTAELVAQRAWDTLPQGGFVAAVDVHSATLSPVADWLERNYGRRGRADVFRALREDFVPLHLRESRGLLGMWRTACFVGRKGHVIR